ncbi:MAG: class I SAM-dependent methyltransferase [Flavobacteriales bacterium]|nr:class I SAM-dependent methyltransferase [Flavobacteriales bacterium]
MQEVSWYQQSPKTSLELITKVAPNRKASIIDVGGGDGFLVDELLKLGYTNITVLDISENAINKAKKRLGKIAEQIRWVISDITEFSPNQQYDVWHDRAVFHFLTNKKDVEKYKDLVAENISKKEHFILATFSDSGPNKCSGLDICKYSEKQLKDTFAEKFKVLDSFTKNHNTPFGTKQNFTFMLFSKI